MPSSAFTMFNRRKKKEVMDISAIFRELNQRRGPNRNYSLLNGALVLLVSSWEIYCEDVCRQSVKTICDRSGVKFSDLENRMACDVVKYAGSDYRDNANPLLQRIARLPDGKWRELVSERLEEHISDFNTPKFSRPRGKNLKDLFRHVRSGNIEILIDDFLEEQRFCARLDEIVTLRGQIAHTGDAPAGNRLNANILDDYTAKFVEAAAAVDVLIYNEIRSRFGFAPWQITNPLKDALRPVARAKI